jgi:Uma2 family endonuclease
MASVATSRDLQSSGEPAWEIARIFPNQGHWSVEDYLLLPGNHLVEYSHGTVEVLPMPTESHQNIVAFLYRVIHAFVIAEDLGKVLFAPLRVRLSADQIREPDVAFMLKANATRRHNEYWDGADWVIEIVSDDDRKRDLETKRFEYARAGIPEYWIVDPLKQQVMVLTLEEDHYNEAGVFEAGDQVPCGIITGLRIGVADIFDAARE